MAGDNSLKNAREMDKLTELEEMQFMAELGVIARGLEVTLRDLVKEKKKNHLLLATER